jgi:hypothetical protein
LLHYFDSIAIFHLGSFCKIDFFSILTAPLSRGHSFLRGLEKPLSRTGRRQGALRAAGEEQLRGANFWCAAN